MENGTPFLNTLRDTEAISPMKSKCWGDFVISLVKQELPWKYKKKSTEKTNTSYILETQILNFSFIYYFTYIFNLTVKPYKVL